MNNSKYLKPPFKQILSSNHERYLTDIWELLPKITSITPYRYVIYIALYPLLTKTSKEVLTYIKTFIEINGKPFHYSSG